MSYVQSVRDTKSGLEAFDLLSGVIKMGKQPFEMTKEEFEQANTHYATSSTGKTHKLGAYIEIKKEFSSEQELTDYVNTNIAKGKSFETQLGYHQSMTHFNDVNYLEWNIDHNIANQYGGEFSGFSVSARKKHEDFIKEAVRNGIDVPVEAIKSNGELSDRLLFHPKYVTENGVPVVTVNNYGAVRDVIGNEFYSFDLVPYDGEPLLKDNKAILDSATSTSISNLVKVVKSAQSGLYALNSLELLIKHATVGNKPIADLIDTSDYNGTFTRLTDRLNIETDATIILGISRIMQGIVNNKKHLELSDETVAYFYDNNPYINPVTDDYKKQLAIDAIEQGKGILVGVVGSEDLDALKSRVDDIKALPPLKNIYVEKLNEISSRLSHIANLVYIYSINGNDGSDGKEDELRKEDAELRVKWNSLKAESDMFKNDPDHLAKAMGGLKLELHEKGKVVIDKLLTASPITQDQANEWVARQKTPKNVYSGLAKKGYPTDKVKADLSEFYRLTHGKLKDVEIVLGGAKRANSKDSNNILAGAIDLGSTPDKRVLFHELAHGLEADALAINLARGFLIKRRKSDKPVSLNKLSGRTGFDANEYAYEDDFINPYVGKVYPESTEVFSMGVECLANPSKFMELVARDPEHAALILQYLSNESEILNATKKLTSSVFNDISESNKKQASEYQTEIKRLASSIVLVDDNPMGKFTRDDKWCITGNLKIKEAELDKAKYVGSIYRNDTYIHIISGSFPKDRSKRLKKGFAVIVAPINQLPSAYAVHKDLDSVKALIYITINKGYAGSDIVWGLSINEHFLTESKIDRIKAFSS